VTDAPREIWLQWNPECDPMFVPPADVTWCSEQINDSDVRYVRADTQPEAPEPDWDEAPEWAQWWAVDADGLTYWYGIVPPTLSPTHDMWDTGPDGFDTPIGYIDLPLGIDWRTTLRRRPEAQP